MQFFHRVNETTSESSHEEPPAKQPKTDENTDATVQQCEPVQDSPSKDVVCPICNKALQRSDNTHINQHIDSCLNMSLVNDELGRSIPSAMLQSTNKSDHTNSTYAKSNKDSGHQLTSSKSLRDYFASSNPSRLP
jgi:hypothetical protein